MIEVQEAVKALMPILAAGGSEAAKKLVTNTIVGGAAKLSQVWSAIFQKKPEAYPLADAVAADPKNSEKKEMLEKLLLDLLSEDKKLLALALAKETGTRIAADHGSVAVNTAINSTITIKNN